MGFLLDSLAEFIRRGADHVVAYAIGFCSCLVIWALWLRPAANKRRKLEQSLAASDAEVSRLQTRLESLEDDLPRSRNEARKWRELAESERSEAGYFSGKLMAAEHDRNRYQSRCQELDAEVEVLCQARDSALAAVADLQRDRDRLTAQHAEVATGLNEELEQLHHTLHQVQADRDRLHLRTRQLQSRLDELVPRLDHTLAQRDAAAGERDEARLLLDAIARVDGNSWKSPPQGEVPAFRRLTSHCAPIIAVVNLKGGVGKTTLTANLAATWFQAGKNVLAVDLDYQNSLTHLCLKAEQVADLSRRQQRVEQLLADPFATGEQVLKFAERIGESTGRLLAAGEQLADVESDILTRWLLKQTDDDVRFRLRRLLHADAVQQHFDAILLDCPPRLSAGCINALACADYVLVPVLLDGLSSEAVPRLLRWLRILKDETQLCPQLAVLGLVANKVRHYAGDLAKQHQDVWSRLQTHCLDPWREPVHAFHTALPHKAAFGLAADHHAFAIRDQELRAKFRDLALEISQRIPIHEGGRTPVLS